MDIQSTPSNPKRSESLLSDSWNIVGSNDINNGSEGSDGESIEVIEEESQVDSFTRTQWESVVADDMNRSVQPVTEDAKKLAQSRSLERSMVCEPYRIHQNRTSNCYRFFLSCLGFYLISLSVILASVPIPFLLNHLDNITLDHLKAIFSYPFGNSANDYQELVNQIKTYKEESHDLRGIVADLNAAVTSLKNELATKNEKQVLHNFADKIVNTENKLFDELLNIQAKHLPTNKDSKGNEKTYHHSFEVIKAMVRKLTVDDESLGILGEAKLFYLIPEYLSVLSLQYSTNKNIKPFINFWKENLPLFNEKIISEIKEMQIKVIQHTVKGLNDIEKLFFKNLCNLEVINKAECTALFIKPYANSNVLLSDEKLFDNEQFSTDEIKSGSDLKIIENNDLKTNVHPAKENEKKHINFNTEMEIEQLFLVNGDGKAANKDKVKKLSDKQVNMNQQKQKVVITPTQAKKTSSGSQVKGMNSDIGKDEVGEEGPSTNSFSSFRRASCERSSAKDQGVQQCRKGRAAEGWWFVRLGQQRARIRRTQGRRSHYLRKKGLLFRMPFFINHRIYAKLYANDKDFMTSQGFF